MVTVVGLGCEVWFEEKVCGWVKEFLLFDFVLFRFGYGFVYSTY